LRIIRQCVTARSITSSWLMPNTTRRITGAVAL
jgi:hypothetical protein